MSKNHFYVYTLKDPRNDEVFYVGKGKGNRRFHHEREARRLKTSNPRKTKKILEILDTGLKVKAEIYKDNLEEQQAFALEKSLIEFYGKQTLTNHSSGVLTSQERAKVLLNRIKPFDVWKAETSPSEEFCKYYWTTVNGLQDIIKHGWSGRVVQRQRYGSDKVEAHGKGS